jgi:hypothetical protein
MTQAKPETSRRARAERVLPVVLVVSMIAVGVAALALSSNETDGNLPLSELVAGMDPGPIHVHGLGINPTDRSLLIATHTGTYRVGANEDKSELIGDNRQDTMGFAVAGPDHFLGSGHPDPNEARRESLPPLLGLIESRDAGRSWRTVSLSGQADFHALRFAGRRVYGYDASHDRLLVSTDAGRRWRQVTRPGPLLDLVVDPRNPRRLVASTASALFFSANEGASWRPLTARTGLLAWPVATRVYMVSPSGKVLASRGVGAPWLETGDIEGQPAALLAQTADELYVALHDGTIKRSADGGRTWRVRSTP